MKAARIYAWDISKRKQAEEALRQSEEKFRLIAETIQDVFWLSNSRLDQIIYVSPAYEELWGRSRESLYASPRSFLEAVHPDDRERVVATVSKGHSQGIPWNHEYRLIRPDGSCRWVQDRGFPIKDEQGNLRLVTGVATDISERKRMEKTLRESEEQYRSLFDHMLDGVAYCKMHFEQCRPVDFTCLKVNGAFETLTGLKNVTGKKVSEVISGIREADPQLLETYGRVALTGKAERFETYVEALGMWFSIMVYSPQKEYFVVLFDVVTERKRAKEALYRLNEELEQRVKDRTAELEAANRDPEAFSYSVSHDLRAPLRRISGFGNILEEKYADCLDSKGQELLGRVQECTQEMNQLIEALFTLSRVMRAEITWQPVNLSVLAEAIGANLKGREPQRRVEFVTGPELMVQGDAAMLRDVLENLLGNAWRFTSKVERARIEFGVEPQADGGPVYFVRDNGAGFDMEYAQLLFRSFQRLHTAKEFPYWIGLATVWRIIQRHGGRVWAEGKVGEGATFYFALPKNGR